MPLIHLKKSKIIFVALSNKYYKSTSKNNN